MKKESVKSDKIPSEKHLWIINNYLPREFFPNNKYFFYQPEDSQNKG